MASWEVSWKDIVKPVAQGLIKRLPRRILQKFYKTKDLERDIHFVLFSEQPLRVCLPKELQAPFLDFTLTLTNMSPYLDARVTEISSFLKATDDSDRTYEIFADFQDLRGFDLPQRSSRHRPCRYWLNEFQLQIVRRVLERKASMQAFVHVCAQSRIGPVSVYSFFDFNRPVVE